MGKRKHVDHVYHSCDWTGLPMDGSYCYVPLRGTSEKQCGKLQKKGSFCTWEAAWCWASQEYVNDSSLLAATKLSIEGLCGYSMPDNKDPYHYSKLSHFGGALSADEYHLACDKLTTSSVTGLQISAAGTTELCSLAYQGDGEFDLTSVFGEDPTSPISRITHTPMRGKLGKGQSLVAFFKTTEAGIVNKVASQAFRETVHGTVVVVIATQQLCSRARMHYESMSKALWQAQFTKRRKRVSSETSVDVEGYETTKGNIQKNLDKYEQQFANETALPYKVAGGAKMPPRVGKELIDIADHVRHMKNERLLQVKKVAQLELRMRGDPSLIGKDILSQTVDFGAGVRSFVLNT